MGGRGRARGCATSPVCSSSLSCNRQRGLKPKQGSRKRQPFSQILALSAPVSFSFHLTKGAWQNGFFTNQTEQETHAAATSRPLVLSSIPAAPDGLRTKPGGCPEYSLFSAPVSFFTTHGERAICSICLVFYFPVQWPREEATLFWKIPDCERCGC